MILQNCQMYYCLRTVQKCLMELSKKKKRLSKDYKRELQTTDKQNCLKTVKIEMPNKINGKQNYL